MQVPEHIQTKGIHAQSLTKKGYAVPNKVPEYTDNAPPQLSLFKTGHLTERIFPH